MTTSQTRETVLEIPRMTGIGDAITRPLETEGRDLPQGTVVISADSHWLEGDIWVEHFPAHLKDRAPRVFFEDGGWEVELGNGERVMTPGAAKSACVFECVPGMNNVPARMKDLDAEGVDKELLFPQKFFNLLRVDVLEEKEWLARAYNIALAEFCAQASDRLMGVGMLNWWDPDATRDAIAEINCYATFMVDPVGMALLDRIGADRAMWSSDYCHNDSTYGYTRSSVEAVFGTTTEENAKKIVGGNAAELFGFAV